MKRLALVYFILNLLLLSGCRKNQDADSSISSSDVYPAKAASYTIYEVNIRQYTPEGTFNAFAKELPRLKDLGVDMLWFMPIHPIGEKNRKEPLGSYYSVKDYKGVNPEFGTAEDFKKLTQQAHDLGMAIILDWVHPNTC